MPKCIAIASTGTDLPANLLRGFHGADVCCTVERDVHVLASIRQLTCGHCVLQYVEEPTAIMDANLEFSKATGIPIALDESLDDAFAHAGASAAVLRSLLPKSCPAPGVAAVVVKPAVLGGFEASSIVASWARNLGMQVMPLTLHGVTCVWQEHHKVAAFIPPLLSFD